LEARGPNRPNFAQSLNILAVLYMAQDRYAEAEPLLNRSLAAFEKALGRTIRKQRMRGTTWQPPRLCYWSTARLNSRL